MGGRRNSVVLVTVLLLAAPVGAAWEQLGGGPGRFGVALLQPASLDVVANYNITEPGEFIRNYGLQGMVSTPEGFQAYVTRPTQSTFSAATCFLVSILDPFDGATSRPGPQSCQSTDGIAAYDVARSRFLLCRTDFVDRDVLRSADAALETAWAIVPTRDLGVVDADVPLGTQESWTCQGVAVDEARGQAVVPFHSGYGRNRVALINLETGVPVWVTTVPKTAFAASDLNPDPPEDAFLQDLDFEPLVATLTETGILLTGKLLCWCSQPAAGMRIEGPNAIERAVVWLSRDSGAVIGSAVANDPLAAVAGPGSMDVRAAQRETGASFWAASSGPRAALALGRELLLVNPIVSRPEVFPIATTERRDDTAHPLWAAPAWHDRSLVVPLAHSVRMFDVSQTQPQESWVWFESELWDVQDVLIAPPDLYVLASVQAPDGREARVLRFSLEGGEKLQDLSLPMWVKLEDEALGSGVVQGSWYAYLMPLPGGTGLMVWDWGGQVTVLGEADAARKPVLRLDEPFPRGGQTVHLVLGVPAGTIARQVRVFWGDGTSSVSSIVDGSVPDFTHEYTTNDLAVYRIRATVEYGDDSTGTGELLVEVNGRPQPPPETLNALQLAFAPQNQDVTLFILGLAVTAIGALVGLARLRRRQRRLPRELRMIEAAYDRTKHDSARCEATLRECRDRNRRLLLDGKLDDGQFAVLERRVEELAGNARMTVLEEEFGFLPHSMVRTLRSMLADARINRLERDQFLHVLDRDSSLSRRQKLAVRDVIESWFEADAGDGAPMRAQKLRVPLS